MPTIAVVGEDDLADLLPLMRAYCDFYDVAPTDEALLAMSRALIADPEREGLQLLGRADEGRAALGFATIFWTWETTRAGRIGIMNDLFVAPRARGAGLAEASHRRVPGALPRARRRRPDLADGARQPPCAGRIRPRRRPALAVAGLRSAGMKVVKPGPEHEVPRGILGGSEVSQATTGASNIYMARFRVPAGARSRPHYHAGCESALYMLAGRIAIRWGEHLEQTLELEPGDLLYVPPRETHIVVNLSDSEPADYVVARDSPTEDSVEVPWADETP